jgi:hypothetical protein
MMPTQALLALKSGPSLHFRPPLEYDWGRNGVYVMHTAMARQFLSAPTR